MKKLLNLFKKSRYFIITFQWEMTKGRSGYGELSHVSSKYPSREKIQNTILENRSQVVKCIITNVCELSKKDFTSYCETSSNK